MTDITQTVQNVTTGASIPLAYQNLGVVSGFNPPEPDKTIMVVLGLSGAGKSTFAASIPNSLQISFQQHGASSILGAHAPRIVIRTYAEYAKLKAQLKQDAIAKKVPFRLITIDTVDEWYELLCDKIIADYNAKRSDRLATHIGEVGAEGKGYAEVAAMLRNELKDLEELGFGLLLTGHLIEKTITVGGEKITVQRTLLPDSAFRVVKVLAYIKAQIQTITITTAKRQLPNGKEATVALSPDNYKRMCQLAVISEDNSSEIKRRLPHLKAIIDLPARDGWATFKQEYDNAVAKGMQEDSERVESIEQ